MEVAVKARAFNFDRVHDPECKITRTISFEG